MAALHVIFLLSGAAGLIYELVWSRYLALFVGHAAYAQALVIGIYLGGMALGALAAGARSSRLRHPLVWYVGAEGLLAVLGALFHVGYEGATGLAYSAVFPATSGSWTLGLTKWGLAALLILPQSIVLGATFPLMTAAAVRVRPAKAGASVASFYFVNSLGGAIGVLVAGFVLVARFGLPGTSASAATLNLVAALGAYAVWRAWAGEGGIAAAPAIRPEPAVPPAGGSGSPAGSPAWALMLGVAALTAVASFAYEIGWIRLLSLAMGSATHAFELMLSAFILGLAVGALLIRWRIDREPAPRRLLGWIQWLMGLAALATLPGYALAFDAMAGLVTWLEGGGSYDVFNLARYGLGLAIMLPSTLLAGMTLPLITSILLRSGAGERAIGAVYGANTLGAIVGVALASTVLMPWLGLKGLLVAGAVLDMGLGVVLLRPRLAGGRVPARAGLALGTAAIAALALSGIRLDRAVLTSGVFRHGAIDTDRQILFYQDGRTATVSAHVTGWDSLVVLSTNGKPDASLTKGWITGDRPDRPVYQQDEGTQFLSPLVALAHVPSAETAAVIGHGSGISAHFLLGSPTLEELVTVEIEPEMFHGSRVYMPANRRVFEDPRSTRVVADAKSYFAQAGRRFDLILSEPSNPWVSGTSTLFSQEFYRRVRRYLTPDGVFGQWFHLYEMSDDLVASVLAAVHSSFPTYRIFVTADTDILIVASNGDRLPEPDWSVFDRPEVAGSLRHVPALADPYLRATRVAESRTLAPLLRGWPTPNSDLFPVLDLGAERARLMGGVATAFLELATRRFSFCQILEDYRIPLAEGDMAPVELARMQSLAVASWLRSGAGSPGSTPPSFAHDEARERLARYRMVLEDPRPPPSWPDWVELVARVEQDLHGVSLTPVDEGFYADVTAYMDRWDAPEAARTAVVLLHALAGGEHAAARDAAIRLLELARPGRTWVQPRVLIEGGVAAALRAGDPAAARTLLAGAGPLTGWAEDDLRLTWMRASVADARPAALRGATSGP
jgi:spermidine synthase